MRWHSQEKTKSRIEQTFSDNELPDTKEEGQERVVSRILGGRCFRGNPSTDSWLLELSGTCSGWGAREERWGATSEHWGDASTGWWTGGEKCQMLGVLEVNCQELLMDELQGGKEKETGSKVPGPNGHG